MAKDFKKNIDYIMSHKMGLDDTFQFRCKACGKCCKNRKDVLLTPYDLFRIARYFGRAPSEIVDQYCETYAGPDFSAGGVCPFLCAAAGYSLRRHRPDGNSAAVAGTSVQ